MEHFGLVRGVFYCVDVYSCFGGAAGLLSFQRAAGFAGLSDDYPQHEIWHGVGDYGV